MKKILFLLLGILCPLGIMAASYTWTHGGGSNTLSVSAAKTDGSKLGTYSKYSISYEGKTYTTCIKMESATTLTFTTSKPADIKVGIALKNGSKPITYTSDQTKLSLATEENTIYSKVEFSGTKTGAAKEDGLTVLFSSVPAGTHVIKRAGSELGVFLIQVEEQEANQVNTPVISVEQGASFGDPSKVSITCSTEGASIYYSTTGTVTTSSTLYKEPFSVETDCTVSCIAVKEGLTDSKEATAEVKINNLRKINYDFSGVTLTQGSAPANYTATDGTTVTLPKHNLYYIKGKTQTAWSINGEEKDRMNASFKASSDITLSPVFIDNAFELGDEEIVVEWSFAADNGACALKIEGNEGYYAGIGKKAGGNGYIDVPMHINAITGAAFEGVRGKVNNEGRNNCAQVNKGTIFTIPAIKGMKVVYTMTNGAPTVSDFSFNGDNATSVERKVEDKVVTYEVTYEYYGKEKTLSIVENTGNFYPAGFKVTYPKEVTSGKFERVITYSWNSPEGTVMERGGKATMKNAPADAANRVNYANGDYYTVCLNGNKDNRNDKTPSTKSTYIEIAFDKPLMAGDSIYITGYRNKDTDTEATIFFDYGKFTLADTKAFNNIALDQEPNTHTYVVPSYAAGSDVLRLTRNASNTNVFITKFEVVRWQKDNSGDFIEVENGGYNPENGLDPSEDFPTGSIESPTRPENGFITFPSDDTENADQSGTVTGIDNASAAASVVAIYTANGKRVNTLQKGLNIVTLSDGSRIKVIK